MKRMTLSPINDGDLLYIARNMRAADKEEIYATRWSDDPNRLVDDCMAVSALPTSYTQIAGIERPIAVFGAVQHWPGVWDVWCFGTDEFPRIGFALTKHIRKVMVPLLINRGAHRVHCRSLSSHVEAHEWLKNLGARPDEQKFLKAWGRGGEDFLMFEWHLEDFRAAMEAA